jgi:fatty acid desaturase
MKAMEIAEDTTSARLLNREALVREVRELSLPNGWRSTWAIAAQWLVIAGAIAAAGLYPRWWVYLIAVVVIGTRQHALGVLTHEAAHYRLFASRAVNDLVSDLFLAFPTGISTSVYRRHHFEHHRYVNTERDPNISHVAGDEDWEWPKLPWQCAKIFARDLIGLNCLYMAGVLWSWSPWPRMARDRSIRWSLNGSERARLILFLALGAAALTIFGGWKIFLLLWIVPACTSLTFIHRVRNLAEHYGVENEHELNASRHVRCQWWERFLFAPCNINYHLDHHLFPSVPFYNLPRLHARLMREEVFAASAHLTESYTGIAKGVLAELIRRESTP